MDFLTQLTNAEDIQLEDVQKVTDLLKSTSDAIEMQKILQILGDLAREVDNRETMGKVTDFIVQLATLIKTSKNTELQTVTVRAIGNLCYEHSDNRRQFHDIGGVLEALVGILKNTNNPSEMLQRNIAGAIANLASDSDKNQKVFSSLGAVGYLAPLLSSQNLTVQMMASRAIANLIDSEESQAELVKNGGLDSYLKFVDNDEEQLQNDLVSVIYSLTFNDALRSVLVSKNIISLLVDIVNGKIETDEAQETALDSLAILADKDDTRTLFLQGNLIQSIMTLITNPNRSKAVSKGVLKIFANLTSLENVPAEFFQYFDLVFSCLQTEELEILVSCLLAIGNLARTDEQCSKMVSTSGFTTTMVKLANHKDLRVQHLALGAIRNLCILPNNRDQFVKEGIIPIMLAHLHNKENPNAHIQFAVVGVFRSLIAGGGDKYLDLICQENGLETLVSLAKGELEPAEKRKQEEEENKEKDKRVEFETARLLVRIADKAPYQAIIAQTATAPLLELLKSKFEVLQNEGLKALLTLAQQGYTKELLNAGVEEVIKAFKSETVSVQNVADQLLGLLQH